MGVPTTYFALYFSEGRRRCYVAASVDELEEDDEYTALLIYDVRPDDWGVFSVDGYRLTSMSMGRTAEEPSWFVADEGEVCKLEKGKLTPGMLPDSGSQGRQLGQPNEIRRIGDRHYVCGYAGQVYVQTKDGWEHMDDGLAESTATPTSIDLDSIDGAGPRSIYVCGSSGLIARWNGKAWKRISVQTNVHLARIRCFGEQHIVAVGNKGVVVEGDGARWSVATIPGAEERTLTDVALYNGRLYVAAGPELYVRSGADPDWSLVKHGLPKKKTTFLRLDVGDGRLWAMGFKRLNSFDGKKWTAHVDPDNG